jgi:hypothetical protein
MSRGAPHNRRVGTPIHSGWPACSTFESPPLRWIGISFVIRSLIVRTRKVRCPFVALALLYGIVAAPLCAQSGDPPPAGSRAEEIQAQRDEKAADPAPDEPNIAKRHFINVKNLSAAVFQDKNPHLQLGGLPSGSGLAMGPVFVWPNSTDTFRGNFSAIGSTNLFYRVAAGATLPKLLDRRLSLSLDVAHSDYPQLQYYGSGPNSSESNETDYRQESTTPTLTLQWNPIRDHLTMQGWMGGLFVNVGPGTLGGIPSSESVFTPAEAPGIDQQTNFFVGAYYFDLDFRDMPTDPHKGGNLTLQYQHYDDLKLGTYSFSFMSADGQYYIPYLHEKRVIALRALTELTSPGPNQVVPFYLQPILGVGGDFRGFAPYRFRGNDLLLFNAEHRWEVSTGWDMALFVDSGRVFDQAHQLSLSGLQNSYGFGFRFKNRYAVVMRLDFGFSKEGFQTWVKFGNVF